MGLAVREEETLHHPRAPAASSELLQSAEFEMKATSKDAQTGGISFSPEPESSRRPTPPATRQPSVQNEKEIERATVRRLQQKQHKPLLPQQVYATQ